jgi:DNA-binding SARP family transcriptional activator
MLGGFRLLHGDAQVALSEGSKRLLALLALRPQSVNRGLVAGTLWPDTTERRAYACLRSALARLDTTGRQAIEVGAVELGLGAHVTVDVRESRALSNRLLDPYEPPVAADLSSAALTALSADLLPDWYDDWVVVEAEEWRQLRLHALEALAGHLIAQSRFGGAAAAAFASVRADPLRESARAVLIRVHLAERNRSEAVHQFNRYRDLLRCELGLEPSPQLVELLPPTWRGGMSGS